MLVHSGLQDDVQQAYQVADGGRSGSRSYSKQPRRRSQELGGRDLIVNVDVDLDLCLYPPP